MKAKKYGTTLQIEQAKQTNGTRISIQQVCVQIKSSGFSGNFSVQWLTEPG